MPQSGRAVARNKNSTVPLGQIKSPLRSARSANVSVRDRWTSRVGSRSRREIKISSFRVCSRDNFTERSLRRRLFCRFFSDDLASYPVGFRYQKEWLSCEHRNPVIWSATRKLGTVRERVEIVKITIPSDAAPVSSSARTETPTRVLPSACGCV